MGTSHVTTNNTPRPPLWTPSFYAVTVGNFLLYFAFYLLLPILPIYIGETFSTDKAVTGLVLASFTIMTLLVRPAGGYLVDTYPRKKVLLVCYTIFMSFFCGYLWASTLLLFTIIHALHGASFGFLTVSNSTMAIDSMPPLRRGEGIGYYGISNNLAMAISPSLSLYLYETTHNFDYIFGLSILVSVIGLCCVSTIKTAQQEQNNAPVALSLNRFILLKAIPEMFPVLLFSFSYGIMSTYLAVYGLEEAGTTGDSGLFFIILSCGFILARLTAGRILNRGAVARCLATGMLIGLIGYTIFITLRFPAGYYTAAFMLGLGYGTMCTSFQTMFNSLAPGSQRGIANSTYFISWDLGVALGVFVGGLIAELTNYATAYRFATVVSTIGLLLFFFVIRHHYERNKLK